MKISKNTGRSAERLIVGRPVLGAGDNADGEEDINRLAGALREDVRLAERKGAALLYMGHGSPRISTGSVYRRLSAEMRRQYPEISVFTAMLDESPSLADVLPEIRAARPAKILLKPLMITAGRHARRDMAGPGPDSWQSRLEAEGFTVEPVLQGLGERSGFAGIFGELIVDAASEAGIGLLADNST